MSTSHKSPRRPGLLLRWFFHRLQRTGNMPPAMTNMGIIDDQRLDFGSPRVSSARLAVPVGKPPMLAPGLTGFRDSLHSASAYTSPPSPGPK